MDKDEHDRSAAIALAGCLLAVGPAFAATGMQLPRMLLVNNRQQGLRLLLLLSNTHAAQEITEQEADIKDMINDYGCWSYFVVAGLKIGWPVKPLTEKLRSA